MEIKVHLAKDRGSADYGWLKAKYSFSFANYYNSKLVNFGALRVLNDDIIQGGMGFGEHPHNNMEIITIPLKGSLKHQDSMSNEWITLQTGEVQVMSAGKGILHSERNNAYDEILNIFQIWIIPNKQEVEPRYYQKVFDATKRENKLQILVSSSNNPVEDSLTIHQDAKISRIDLTNGISFLYTLTTEKHGVFIMVISGRIAVENEILQKKDAITISEKSKVELKAKRISQLLIIEVPMSH